MLPAEDTGRAALARRLGLLALVTLALRLYIHLLSPIIAGDAAYYLYTADQMRRGDLAGALSLYGLHPLYPWLVSVAGAWIPDLAVAAVMISLGASAACVGPLYALYRTVWTPRLATAGVLLFALHPILAPETADALPTALFLLLFLGALASGFHALRGGRWFLYPLAGACCALAYLTRTEGLLSGILLVGAAIVTAVRRWKEPGLLRIAGGVAAAVVVALVLAGPYVAHLSRKSGKFTITSKGGGTVLLNTVTGDEEKIPGADARFAYLPVLRRKLSYAFFAPLLPFLAMGLYLERKETRRRLGHLVVAAAALAPPILLFTLHRHFRPSHRYFLAGVVLLLPWIASAMLALIEVLRRRYPRAPLLAGAAALLLLALLLGKNLAPHRPEEAVYGQAGAWLKEHPPTSDAGWRLLSSSDKLSWYAGARHVPFVAPSPAKAVASILEQCRAEDVALLALDGRTVEEVGRPGLHAELELAGFVPLKAFEAKGGALTVQVYRPPR